MTIGSNRLCATCVAYENGECMNLVSFRCGDAPAQAPKPTDSCHNHKTQEEDRRDDEAMARFRVAGVKANKQRLQFSMGAVSEALRLPSLFGLSPDTAARHWRRS